MEHTRSIYLIGIGGVGMVWIADYALGQGWKVSGSDLVESPVIERLREAGAEIHIGSNPEAIPSHITEAVYTSAITPSAPAYPEYEELVRRNIPMVKRAVWIGTLTRSHYTIAVSGAHGKTTVTAMIGWILDKAGFDPTVFCGGAVSAWDMATRIGSSKYLVIEADEYDRSFHQFYPQIAVVLNIDLDHTDYYKGGLPEIMQSYRRFLRNLPSGVHANPRGRGMVVAHASDKNTRQVVRGFKYAYRFVDPKKSWPGLTLKQPGRHMLYNATVAARVAHELGVTQKDIISALATFPGVSRRFEYLGNWNEATLFDDYAHHPAEVAATLEAIRESWPKGGGTRTTVVFQPHQKARTKELLGEFSRCFDKNPPDNLILAPIYQVASRETDIDVKSEYIADLIQNKLPDGMELEVAGDTSQLRDMVEKATLNPGIVVVMGAGDIRSLTDSWRFGK